MTTHGMDADAPVIACHGLRRTYGSGARAFEAVRGVDITVQRGELFALLGTNGAGKTSTLEVLEGMAAPTAGSVAVFGHDPVRDRQRVRARTGILLQETGLTAELTVAEIAVAWHRTLARSIGASAALAAVGLTDRSDVLVPALSGGERRRLDLAMTVMSIPELVFLDEPTAGLDPESRHAVWRLVTAMLDAGSTVVLTTHYLEEAEHLAQRLAIMHQGRIVREGTVAQIVADEPSSITVTSTDASRSLPLAQLPGLLSAPRDDGRTIVMDTADLQETMLALLLAAQARSIDLEGLEGRSATLERAFLAVAASGDTAAAPEPSDSASATSKGAFVR